MSIVRELDRCHLNMFVFVCGVCACVCLCVVCVCVPSCPRASRIRQQHLNLAFSTCPTVRAHSGRPLPPPPPPLPPQLSVWVRWSAVSNLP